MSRNDITGDELKSKVSTDDYRNNFDRIFNGNGITEVKQKNELNDELKKILIRPHALLASALLCLDNVEQTSVVVGVRKNIFQYITEAYPELIDTLKIEK
jgi:hypothetical protein